MSDAAPEQPSRPPGWLSRFVPHRLGLRNRILLTFTLGVAVLAIVLAFTTYGLTRSTLLRQEEDSALDQAFRNARQVRATLRAEPGVGLRRPGGRPGHRRVRALPALSRRVVEPQPRVQRRQHPAGAPGAGDRGPRPVADGVRGRAAGAGHRHPPHRRRRQLLRDRAPRADEGHPEQRAGVAPRRRRHHDRGGRPPRRLGCPPRRAAPGRRRARPRRRSPVAASAPGSNRARTPTSRCSRARSTTWPRRSSTGSSATPASPRTSATSCGRR